MTDALIAEELQKAEPSPQVELYEIDATEIFGEILRFTPVPLVPDPSMPAPAPIVWRGEIYSPRPCETDGWEWDGTGPLPTPTMKLGNVDLAISALAIAYNDMLGAGVTRRRTFQRFLDGMPDADPEIELDADIFRLERKIAQNNSYVEFELGTAIDVAGRLLPGRQVLQSYCPLRYRRWDALAGAWDYSKATCPYADEVYFTLAGEPTADPAQDRAAKRLGLCCAKRYPGGQPLPFGGFPGVARFRG